MVEMKKLPIGVQNFESLRSEGYFYVDKTELIYRMVSQGRYYFLSRPRRFGKSLLMSTIKALYQGKKELFDGTIGKRLAIANKADITWEAHPVLHLDLNTLITRTSRSGITKLTLVGAEVEVQNFRKQRKRLRVSSAFFLNSFCSALIDNGSRSSLSALSWGIFI